MAKLEFRITTLPTDRDLDLRDILAVLNPRAERSEWELGYPGDTGFWAMGKDVTAIEALVASRQRVSGKDLARILEDIHQIISGEFRAFDGPSTTPWATVNFMDGTWIEIESDEEAVLALFRQHFDARPLEE